MFRRRSEEMRVRISSPLIEIKLDSNTNAALRQRAAFVRWGKN